MRENMIPKSIDIAINDDIIAIETFDSLEEKQNLHGQAVNIFASGPSISDINFNQNLLNTPSIFVNGSLSLLETHLFSNVVGYIISDERFVRHQPELLAKSYGGQPLYATVTVIEAIASYYPQLVEKYQESIRIIFPVNRPLAKPDKMKPQTRWNKLLTSIKKNQSKKIPLTHFLNHPSFVIEEKGTPQPIGVSLDITDGFVEAGTVAYVAAQLAFSRQASTIHLYGIDLLNSNQPRFYESKDNNAPSKLDKATSDRIVPSFNLLSKVYKEHQVAVINHSPISKSLFDSFD